MPTRGSPDFSQLIEIPEADLVSGVFSDRLLIQSVGIPPQMRGPIQYRLEVAPESIGLDRDAFGDADGLLVEEQAYDLARAVEYKRVKISAKNIRDGRPSGLNKLRKAVHQANALYEAGFAFVWLVVIVVADVRSITGNVGFAGAPMSLISQVHDAVRLDHLHPDIGVSVHEIDQVSDKPANQRGGAGGKMIRGAVRRAQPSSLTAALATFFAAP